MSSDSFTLIINSENIKNVNTNATFEYKFIGGGFTVEEGMQMMLSSAQIPYSINNITQAYNNQAFTFRMPTGALVSSYTTFNIVIPEGFYTIDDLNSYMQYYAIANGLYLKNADGNNVYYTPVFTVNQTYYSIEILLYTVPRSLPSGWTAPSNWIGYSTYTSDRTGYITILDNNFKKYIGFTAGNYPPTAPATPSTSNYSVLSTAKPPLATVVNSIIVHCSLVNNSVITPSDIVDSFPITNAVFGQNISYEATVPKFVKLTRGKYSSMTISLTDQNNNNITLIDPNILMTFVFQKNNVINK
jgi:hypothetical protein